MKYWSHFSKQMDLTFHASYLGDNLQEMLKSILRKEII